jgi:L-iditol 2-dehydrogenase
MQALILHAPGNLSLEEIPSPAPEAGDVLIRVEAATTCGTDLKAFLRGHPQIPMPGTLGHEYSGEVIAVGEGAEFQVGDKVMGVHSAPCQQCRSCRRGQENLCDSIMATKVLGSYAEKLLIPARIAHLNLFQRPPQLKAEIACLLEPLACVAQAISRIPVNPNSSVLVIGPGAVGLMFVAALRRLGMSDITLAGRNPNRLRIGEQFGAKIEPFEGLQGTFDIVIECTGKVEVWERSLAYCERGGTLVLFGGCPSGTTASFDTKKLHYDDITLISPFHFGTQAVQLARTWLLDPSFDLSDLISGERSLRDGAVVFQDLEEGRGIKYVFRP